LDDGVAPTRSAVRTGQQQGGRGDFSGGPKRPTGSASMKAWRSAGVMVGQTSTIGPGAWHRRERLSVSLPASARVNPDRGLAAGYGAEFTAPFNHAARAR
jgi:hypothetical protein